VDANGVATSTTFTASGAAGSYSLSAFAAIYNYGGGGYGVGTVFSLTNIAGPPAQIIPANVPFKYPLSTLLGTAFPGVPIVTVTDSGGNRLGGVPVIFSAPGSGPSANFGATSTYTTVTDGSGEAIAEPFTANGIPGAYNIYATVAGVATPANLPMINIDYSLAMHTPGVMQITRGTPATVRLDVATIPANTAMPATASLSCSVPGTLINAFCSANPPAFFQGQALRAITLTIFTKGAASSRLSPRPANPDPGWPASVWSYLAALLAVSVGSVGLLRREASRAQRLPAHALLVLMVSAAAGLLSCGGGNSTPAQPTPPPSANTSTPLGPSIATVTATVPTNTGGPGGISKSITININVN